jgi:signal transduction histidine kinase/DNA-binding response OmpR family regulator
VTQALGWSYLPWLVALSFVVATLAAYAALGLASRIAAAGTPGVRRIWLGSGASAMGIGIWAMHFIGMLAVRLDPPATYDLPLTLWSIVPAVVASAIALRVTSRATLSWAWLVVGGVFMGLGIGAMHYIGMAAMRMAAELRYDPVWFSLSLVVAALFSVVALWSHHRAMRDPRSPLHWTKIRPALVMGTAVVSMHYTGMTAAVRLPTAVVGETLQTLDPRWLAFWVSAASILTLGLAILVVLVDTRLQAAASVAHATRRQLFRAIEAMSEAFSLWDANGRLEVCNSRYRSFYPGLNVMPGCTYETLARHAFESGIVRIPPDDRERWVDERLRLFRTSATDVLERTDGSWLQISRTQMPSGETIILYTDITYLQQTAQELESARAQAEAANEAKSQFLSSMSHELRTPLNGVLGYSQILQRDLQLSVEHRESLQAIEHCGEHLLALINDVLDFSRIESGQLDLQTTACNLPKLLTSVCAIVRPRADAKGLSLTLVTAPDLPRAIRVDQAKLRQVIVNLLGNATKFTDQGGVTLEVSERFRTDLVFTIRDTGVGIPASQIEDIFDAFRQTEAGKAVEGTGLGLAISRRLVEAMGGTLTAESEVGRGSVFTATLPLVEENEATLETADESRQPEVVRLAPGQEVAVLVADDRDTNRDILVRLLEGAGFTTQEAVNGQEALDTLRSGLFPLVLMDIRMPVMGGLEATRLIRRDPTIASTVVIGVSASVFPDSEERIVAAGCDDFLTKPLRASELFAKIGQHMGVSFINPTEASTEPRDAAAPLTEEQAGRIALRLRDAVDVGDVSELDLLAEELRHEPGSGRHYGDTIGRLARAFDFDGLLALAAELERGNPGQDTA